ncbi:MAG: hypothetical protein ACI38A_02645 [Candidatus Ornithomonoglobus sp.]
MQKNSAVLALFFRADDAAAPRIAGAEILRLKNRKLKIGSAEFKIVY